MRARCAASKELWVTGWHGRGVSRTSYKFSPRRQVFQRAASQPPPAAIVVHAIRSRVKSTPGRSRTVWVMPAAAESRLLPAREVEVGIASNGCPVFAIADRGVKNRRHRPGTHVHAADTEERSGEWRRKRTKTEGGGSGNLHGARFIGGYASRESVRVGQTVAGQVVSWNAPAVNGPFVPDVSIWTRK